jgi:hypothetical protein
MARPFPYIQRPSVFIAALKINNLDDDDDDDDDDDRNN